MIILGKLIVYLKHTNKEYVPKIVNPMIFTTTKLSPQQVLSVREEILWNHSMTLWFVGECLCGNEWYACECPKESHGAVQEEIRQATEKANRDLATWEDILDEWQFGNDEEDEPFQKVNLPLPTLQDFINPS